MPFTEVSPPPTTSTTPGAAGKGPPVDSFSASIPGGGGIPEQQANIAADNAAVQQRQIAARAGQVGVDTAAADERGAAAALPLAEDFGSALQRTQDEFAPKLKRAADDYDRAQAEASNFKYEDHWADQSTGTKALAAISSFLGGLATGAPVNRVQEWIDRDFAHQKEQATRLLEVAKMRGADQEHLLGLQDAIMKNLNTAYLGKIEAVKRQVEAEAKKQGTEQARVNADKAVNDLDVAAAAKKQADAQQLHIQAVTHSLKALKALFPQLKTGKINGTPVYKDPRTGLWEEFLKPAPPPTPAVAPAPVVPAPPAPGLGGFDVNAAANNLAAVGR